MLYGIKIEQMIDTTRKLEKILQKRMLMQAIDDETEEEGDIPTN